MDVGIYQVASYRKWSRIANSQQQRKKDVRPNFPKEDGDELRIYDQTRVMTKRPGAPRDCGEMATFQGTDLARAGLTARCLDFDWKVWRVKEPTHG